jgi:2-phospho-L-lactate guanylyltransferase
MRALLLPIKDLKKAKQRLAPVLTAEERFGLVQAMLVDTIRALQGVRRAEKIFVVTNYRPALDLAEENHWEILREDRQFSESHSVDFASRVGEERGVTGLLRVPLDVPLMQAKDIDELLMIKCGTPGLVIVPSRDRTGTNAIFRTPPTLFRSHFGPGSFAKHVLEAEKAGAQVIIRNNPRLEIDVDDETDLRMLLEKDIGDTETGRWLRESGVESRFRPNIKAWSKFAAKA